MKKIQLDRAKWRCGGNGGTHNAHGKGFTRMLNPEKFQCCLGLAASQLGIADDALLNRSLPGSIPELLAVDTSWKFPAGLNVRHWTSKAININDSDIPLPEKEKLIVAAFLEGGYEAEFVGEY